ncbi:phosphatidylglycerophosphatase A [Vibrio sp.]|uniref:Phosphatidylglycerophosphatase A n=1 Tax=Vibrio viridaestus TaxID=2487322 RepID=A0A3N9TI30_9VIBR|nr:phosphatidylglycerophosphatase A [Vibrio viridaestus]MDC0609898.1 phosphatidylglycerophosphatase A [Vibrio sp.]RQW63937.1 phosphatidylglycerophosphatase A [Vibrio viridaestus]
MSTKPLALIKLSNPWHLLATGFGSGLSPVIPGTMGTLASIPFYLILAHTPAWFYIVVILIASVIGIKICAQTSHDMKVHDHGAIVWDEFVGFWITMIMIPLLDIDVFAWQWIVLGFVYFRFFDMLKPWPIRWFDKNIHGGWGIMVDDIVAGFVSALALWITYILNA